MTVEQELWQTVYDFPDYDVSTLGNVVNVERRTSITPRPNQFGHIRVGLVRDGTQYTRALALVVATAFISQPNLHWNTPIHLDGDLWNCKVDNLMWRPRWFAIKFQKQFSYASFHESMNVKLIDPNTDEIYESVKEVCVKNGLYWYDVVEAYMHGTFVFPTDQEFILID